MLCETSKPTQSLLDVGKDLLTVATLMGHLTSTPRYHSHPHPVQPPNEAPCRSQQSL